MSFTYGFYNSSNHDRVYDAKDFSDIFNGIIVDGVFQSIGTGFIVKADGTNKVTVGIGRAWLNGTWNYNDALMSLTLPSADLLYPRIDAVIIEVNETTRTNEIKVLEGTAATNPVNPSLTKTTYVHQYPICYIRRGANNDNVTQSAVTNRVGSTELPWVTGILKTISMNELLGQWEAELDEFVDRNEKDISGWFGQKKSEFDVWVFATQAEYDQWIQTNEADFLAWYERMKDVLNADVVGNMQGQIDNTFDISTGSVNSTVTFGTDGTITEDSDAYIFRTTFPNGNVQAVITEKSSGRTRTNLTTFNSDGSITNTSTKFA